MVTSPAPDSLDLQPQTGSPELVIVGICASAAGMNGLVAKPIAFDSLVEAITQAVAERGLV